MKQMKKAAAFCLCLLLGIQSVSQWGNVDVYADADTDVAQSLTLEVGGKEEVKVTLSEEESIAVSSENSKIADGIVTGKSSSLPEVRKNMVTPLRYRETRSGKLSFM